jgi:hypothetical protein
MDWTWIDRGFYLAIGCILALFSAGVVFLLAWIAMALIVQAAKDRRERRWREANRKWEQEQLAKEAAAREAREAERKRRGPGPLERASEMLAYRDWTRR